MLTASHYKTVLYNTWTEEDAAYRIIFFFCRELGSDFPETKLVTVYLASAYAIVQYNARIDR